mmetsp:Transcript_40479/g.41132  ORF Transcript_40479/g.41132 Transcript_40479/m.41132 type:complete len:92 (-) Transcript_40479:179-454(-)
MALPYNPPPPHLQESFFSLFVSTLFLSDVGSTYFGVMHSSWSIQSSIAKNQKAHKQLQFENLHCRGGILFSNVQERVSNLVSILLKEVLLD